ncbi:hypothetical protein C8Q70DRAFT_596490 [Cubamyces menziesii]|nr:hypothetical protein C8Q70DRAFT_596490 [Cubamyces menziesii]
MDTALPSDASAFPTEIYERIIICVDLTCVWSLPDCSENPLEPPKNLSIEAHRGRLSTLYACALACRAWFPASRFALYRDLVFLSTDRISFERLVQSLNANPWLGMLLHTLSVIDNHKTSGTSLPIPTSDCVGDISNTWPVILASKTSKLPRLHTLHLTLVDGLTRYPQYIRSMRTLNSVTTLSLAWRSSGSFADLFRLIAAFPNLRTLSLDAEHWIPMGSLTVLPPRRFPQLSQLTIVASPSLEHKLWGGLSYVLLQAVASSIKVLDIPVSCIPYDFPDLSMFSGHPIILSCLQTLRVRDDSYRSAWRDGVNWILRSGPVLKRLVMDLPPLRDSSTLEYQLPQHHSSMLACLATTIIASKITLLVTCNVPRNLILHALHDRPSRPWMPWGVGLWPWDPDEQFAEIKAVWSGSTEDLNRVHLTVPEPDNYGEVSYVPPKLELTPCPLERVGSYGPQRQEGPRAPGILTLDAELELRGAKDRCPQLQNFPPPNSPSLASLYTPPDRLRPLPLPELPPSRSPSPTLPSHSPWWPAALRS